MCVQRIGLFYSPPPSLFCSVFFPARALIFPVNLSDISVSMLKKLKKSLRLILVFLPLLVHGFGGLLPLPPLQSGNLLHHKKLY